MQTERWDIFVWQVQILVLTWKILLNSNNVLKIEVCSLFISVSCFKTKELIEEIKHRISVV